MSMILEREQKPAIHAPASGRRSALLVGLQGDELRIVRAVLNNRNYASQEAGSYEAALGEIQQRRFSLYISDRSFPRTNQPSDQYRDPSAPLSLDRILKTAYCGDRFNYAVISNEHTEPELPETVKVIWREHLTGELRKYLDELRGS